MEKNTDTSKGLKKAVVKNAHVLKEKYHAESAKSAVCTLKYFIFFCKLDLFIYLFIYE